MNKADPNRVVDALQMRLEESLLLWREILTTAPKLNLRYQRLVSRDAFLRAAVAWEVFRSDWHIAAAARDASVLSVHLANAARSRLSSNKETRGLAPYVRTDLPRHPSLAAVRELIDSSGSNVDLSAKKALTGGVSEWQAQARSHLVERYSRRVTQMPIDDLKVAALVESLRDCLAHESPRSTEHLRSAIASLGPTDRMLFGSDRALTPAQLPVYLHQPKESVRRVEHFHQRLHSTAEYMRV